VTPTQRNAVETREVDGKREDVLRAVAAVVLDAGYYFRAADKDAGLITAARVPAQFQDAFCRSGGMNGPVMADTVAVWVRTSSPTRCEVRLQRRVMGHIVDDERAVTEFWTAVQRRMIAGDAAPLAGAKS
jgi:hypothetical protein